MTGVTDVAIIGAGPYGLSLAAFLRGENVDFRIFGVPMRTWREQVLRDSHLKSEGFATGLYEPSGSFTLRAYCKGRGLPYADTDLPVSLTTFVEYGLAFQQRYVPMLETSDVVALAPSGDGFALRLANGETAAARRVIVAVGISHFSFLPPELSGLPGEHVTHSNAHATVDRFAGRDVVVVGAGASALDVALELVRVGAKVRIVARRHTIPFHGPPAPRSLLERIRAPATALGQGWRSFLCVEAPLVFHAMPERFRIEVVRRHLGPAPGWFTREGVEGKAVFLMDRRIETARPDDGAVRLTLRHNDGNAEEITADHVISATGYQVDLTRLGFIAEDLRAAIRLCDTSPVLSTHFESSVSGLYFVGLAAANSFGPLSRFAYGARFTATRLSAHLARAAGKPRGESRPASA
jgi:cation diffusion facilitator CzcD-associated flavoprotein CzcO